MRGDKVRDDETIKLRRALEWAVRAYKIAIPVRSAEMHPETCTCLRCAIDHAEAMAKEMKHD